MPAGPVMFQGFGWFGETSFAVADVKSVALPTFLLTLRGNARSALERSRTLRRGLIIVSVLDGAVIALTRAPVTQASVGGRTQTIVLERARKSDQAG